MKKPRLLGPTVQAMFLWSLSLAGTAVAQQERASVRGSNPSVVREQRSQSASPLPPAVPAGRPSIGVAFEGGGALGLAHIGLLAWMEENYIPVDRISGTSMGALVERCSHQDIRSMM